jgi:hypothetical protein
MTTPANRFREQLRAAGITPDKPLHAVLTTAFDTAVMAQKSVKGGARGLTPEGEQELIRRVTDAAAESTEREAERIVRRFDLGMVLKVAMALALFALAGGGGGYWLGMREVQVTERRIAAAFADGTATARHWAELMENNDLNAALARCTGNQVTVTAGRRACLVPLWLDGAKGAP